MSDYLTLGSHGVIIGLLVWVVKHVRSIRIEMKNGRGSNE